MSGGVAAIAVPEEKLAANAVTKACDQSGASVVHISMDGCSSASSVLVDRQRGVALNSSALPLQAWKLAGPAGASVRPASIATPLKRQRASW